MSGASQSRKERIHTFLVLKVSGQPDRVIVWDTQDISLGRSAENDIELDDAELSRRHAEFYRGDNACFVKDLGTSNGTLVNGRPIENHTLKNKDIVQVGAVEVHFYQVARNPATLGPKAEYASQLKNFGGAQATGDGDATILGLVDTLTVDEPDDDFVVRPVSDFDHGLAGTSDRLESAAAPRDLDLELEDLVDGRSAAKSAPAGSESSRVLSLNLEIHGLTGDLRRTLEALMGKVLDLPPLRIRIKGDDLG